MKRTARLSSTTRWVSAESAVAESLVALDASDPDWDEGPRLEGAIRRLSRDATPSAIRAAISVYGIDIVLKALSSEALQRAATKQVQEVRVAEGADFNAEVLRWCCEFLRPSTGVATQDTARELVALTLLASAGTANNAGQGLGLSKHSADRHVRAARRELVSQFTPRQLLVLNLLASGGTANNAGQDLGFSKHSADRHVRAAKRKLISHSLKDVAELAKQLAAMIRLMS